MKVFLHFFFFSTRTLGFQYPLEFWTTQTKGVGKEPIHKRIPFIQKKRQKDKKNMTEKEKEKLKMQTFHRSSADAGTEKNTKHI